MELVLIVLQQEFLSYIVKTLDKSKVNLVKIFTDNWDEKYFLSDDKKVSVSSFSEIYSNAENYQTSAWLIIGSDNGVYNVKKFLITLGIDENKIFGFNTFSKKSPTWIANYNYVENNGADFFATGDEIMCTGLNIKAIPCSNKFQNTTLSGVKLSDVNQDLQTSFFIAKNVFATVKPNTIKFVFIGLHPNVFHQNNPSDFFNVGYMFFLESISTKIVTDEPAKTDLNFNKLRKSFYHGFSQRAVTNWQDYPKPLSDNVIEKNVQVLKDYIDLCVTNNAKPIGVVFPIAPAARKTYDEKILTNFREIIHKLEESTPFVCVDMFDSNMNYNCFADMTHMNFRGCECANGMIAVKLYEIGLIPIENFYNFSYAYFDKMSYVVPKDKYIQLMDGIFKLTARIIGRKEKIKVGFMIYDSSQWCGDDLYNQFANDERFETTLFSCLKYNQATTELVRKDFWKGLERFKEHGLNVVGLDKVDAKIPKQDIIFYCTPYLASVPKVFRLKKMRTTTLIVVIPYGISTSVLDDSFYNRDIFRTAYKYFCSSQIEKKQFQNSCPTGLPQAVYSGYPRIDTFLNKTDLKFDWKMTRPDVKKIVYAPHWSINAGIKFATFQWNYQFMYEFAKEHPEISWVIKPHPTLFFSAVAGGVFPTFEALDEYFQKWNNLPNAKLYTGAYYQEIFATSDGIIHDCGSFIAEYLYADKPQVFLTRHNEHLNDLGEGILKVSYLVDGKDWEKIAATMQKVFIEGNDYKAEERKKFFDENLNYFKQNGMSASEFIYKTICKDLGIKTS